MIAGMRAFLLFASLAAALAFAAPAAAQPSLTSSAKQIYHGDIVYFRGVGFTPRGDLLAHLIRPDGTEYPETPFKADEKGLFAHEITIVPNTFGTYELLVEDLATKTSASQRFLMVPHGFSPAVTTQADRMPAEIAGLWQGTVASPASSSSPLTAGSKPAGRNAHDAVLTLSGGPVGGVVGTVSYPTLLCGGEVWLIAVTKDSVQLGEVITYGEERCTGRALVTARAPQKGALAYAWRDVMNRGAATGTLSRRN